MKTEIQTHENSIADPLYTIFENVLFDLSNSSTERSVFIANVVDEYLKFLAKRKLTVPPYLESSVLEELSHQVSVMLTKRMYGFLTIDDFKLTVTPQMKKRAKERFRNIK